MYRPASLCLITLLAIIACPIMCAEEGPQAVDMGAYLQGRSVFQTQCSPCHGRTGRGDGEWAEGVEVKPRNFRTGLFKFRTTPAGTLPTQNDLIRTLRRGVSGTMMPAFTKMSDADVKAVLTYIRSFSSRWDEKENYAEPVELPAIPDWWADTTLRKDHAASARTDFTLTCAACHGAEGRGDGAGGAALIDIWENPIKPADLTAAHFKSGDSPSDLFRTIALGLDGTPMASFLEPLGADKIWNLIALIDQLKTP